MADEEGIRIMNRIFCHVCNRDVQPIEEEGLIVCPRCRSIITRSSGLHEEQVSQPEEQPKQSTERYSSTGEIETHKSRIIIRILIGCIIVIVIVMIVMDPFGLLPAF